MAKASRVAARTAKGLEAVQDEVAGLKGSILSMHSKLSAIIKRMDKLEAALEESGAASDAPDEGGGE